MDGALFTARSIWTMVHGVVLGGGALIGLGAALFAIGAMRVAPVRDAAAEAQSRRLAWLLRLTAAALWLTVLVGIYVNFPPYRATPPEGTTDLRAWPKALVQSSPETEWLHSFAMETKEHVPWIAAILATAVASAGSRYRSQLLRDPSLRRMAMALLAVSFALSAFAGVLGIFVNKVAPLD